MINQHEWLRTRKNLLAQVKSQVRVRLGPLPGALRQYAKNLDRDFRAGWKPAKLSELQKALDKSTFVLSADFHAYAQSQRAHIRILRDQVADRPVILALECLPESADGICGQYLAGKISERKFLEAVGWEKNWGFPWENYRPIFELARDRGFKIRGLNESRQKPLNRQDASTARKLWSFHEQYPAALIFVVIGEWHLAMAHLPHHLRRKTDRLLVIHQDVESLYFRLAQQNREAGVDLMKAGPNRFCLMVSPPWMKWQSYLMYLEHAYDRELQEGLAIDYTDHVLSLIELLETDLKIQTKKTHIEVYCPNSKISLGRLRLGLGAKAEKALLYHLAGDQSFFVPEKNWFYLSRPTINHASSLAGQFVHAQLCRRSRVQWNLPADFLALIWVEAVGFFFSKWINPKRKPETIENLRLRLQIAQPKDRGQRAMLLALDHRLSEVLWVKTGRMRRARYKARGVEPYVDAARIIGSMLGERLFQKVRSRTISLNKLMNYLKVKVDGPDFETFYWTLIRELEHDQAL